MRVIIGNACYECSEVVHEITSLIFHTSDGKYKLIVRCSDYINAKKALLQLSADGHIDLAGLPYQKFQN